MASALPLNVDVEGNTALHRAAREGDLVAVQRLLAAGADVTARNRDGHTALWMAAWKEHDEVYAALSDAGAETDDTFLELMDPRDIRWGGYEPEEETGRIFLMVGGHGSEKLRPFPERDRLPAGYTLVTFVRAGSLVMTDTTFLKLLVQFERAKPAMLQSIASTRSGLEAALKIPAGSIHVYEEGDLYPDLRFLPYADVAGGVRKSGMYEYPARMRDFFTEDGTPVTFAPEDTEGMYADSVYPTAAAADLLLRRVGGDSGLFQKVLQVPVREIMEQRGPGVYFFVVCRSVQGGLQVEDAVETAYRADPARFEPYIRDIPGHYEKLLEELGIHGDAEDRAKVAAILSQRKLSSEQQARKRVTGGARRTQRRRRITRK
jgi:hypothetical protein